MMATIKTFYLFLILLWSLGAQAEPFYFSDVNKKLGLDFYKKQIYGGCGQLKQLQEPITPKEMKKNADQVLKIVNEDFSKAFQENPLVKVALLKDLDRLMKDTNCQRPGNDCRSRMVSVPLFYYQRLRADIPGCQQYVTGKSPLSQQCEIENKFRTKDLKTVPKNYGAYGIGTYKDELKVIKNNTTRRIFNFVMYQDKTNLHICEEGSMFKYALNVNDPGEYQEGLDPESDPARLVPKECTEEKVTLWQHFLPTDFEDRATVGEDQIAPLKNKIAEFVKENPELIVSDIEILASASQTPFYKEVKGKKIIDPESDKKNIKLAQERAFFAKKVLNDLKAANSLLSKVEFTFKAGLSGPRFEPRDLNERFVTRMTPGYLERIEAIYKQNEKEYLEKALKNYPHELLDEKQYGNLYQAKYKPFQGFRIIMSGYRKAELKCDVKPAKPKTFNRSSKQ